MATSGATRGGDCEGGGSFPQRAATGNRPLRQFRQELSSAIPSQPDNQLLAEGLQERSRKGLEAAKSKHAKVDSALQRKLEREKKIKEAGAALKVAASKDVARSRERLQGGTKASDMARLTAEGLDEAERKRRMASAHAAPVALTGRDLRMGGGRGNIPAMRYLRASSE